MTKTNKADQRPEDGHADGGVSNRDVAKGAGTTLLARLGGVLDLLTQPLYVWLFGLASYGFYGALWAAINLIENVADLGMTSAMQRVVPQAKTPQEEASALRASFILALIPCTLVAAIVSFTAEPVATFFNASDRDASQVVDAIRYFAWALPLWAFVEIATSALRSKRLFGAEIRLRLLWEQLVRLGFVLVFFALGFGMLSLVYAHILSLSIICLLCVRLLNQHFQLRLLLVGPIRDPMFHEALKAGLAVLPVNIVTRLFGDGPAIALNAILPGSAGAIAGGLFIIARKVSSVVQLVRTAFAYVLAPLASSAATYGKDQVAGIYGFSTRLSFALALPLGAMLAASGPTLLPLFGPGADAALFALVALTLARVAEAVFGAATPIQQVTSAHLDQQLGSLVGLGVATAIAWWLIPNYGLNAMAIAVSVGLVIAALLPLFQLHIINKLHPFAAPFGTVMVRSTAIAAGGAALALLVQELPLNGQRICLAIIIIAAWRLSWKLAATLLGIGLAEYLAVLFVPSLEAILPYLISLSILIPLLVATLWTSLKFALTVEDKAELGKKTVQRLKLA
jgi:O-antigen/teichoic acid export membrane protein